MRFFFAGVLLVSTFARAQSLSVSVMEAEGLSAATLKRVHRAAVEQLKQLVALPVSDALEWKGKKCTQSDAPCQRERVKAAGAPASLALWLKGSADTVTFDAVFWLEGERVSAPKNGDATTDGLEFGLRPVLEAVVPGWMRRGWGGLRLTDSPGGVFKLDGRVLPARRPDVVPVPAGPHQLDVLFADGRAVLRQVDVQEANRVVVAEPGDAPAGAGGGAFSALRVGAYAAFMVGAATLLSAFIVGFVGRQTTNGQNPCRPDSRECPTIEEAMEQSRKAAGYAFTANVLMGTGLVLSLAGVGLFTFDALR